MLNIEALKAIAPKPQRTLITQDLVDKINSWNEDPKLLSSYSDNVLSYMNILTTGKYKMQDYLNAVRFVSYKLIGLTDIDAYIIVFPERYKRLENDGLKRSEISPYITAFKHNKLVVQIFEQTIVPSHVLNAPMHQEALNIAMNIAANGRSEVARVNACNTILANTKPPETTQIKLDVSINETDEIQELKSSLASFASVQMESIEKGQVTLKDLGKLKTAEEDIIDVEEV